MKFKIIFLLFMLIANCVSAASFDCKKSSKKVEFSICDNSSLNEKDTELGNVYKVLRHSLSDDESIMLRNEQRLWIKLRDQACLPSDIDCLMFQITSRTQELKRKMDIKKYAESSIPEYTPSYYKKSCNMELPSLACSPENRNTKAVAMCAMVMGGCEIVTQKLSSSSEKYVAGQVCSLAVSQLSGQQYDINNALKTFMLDASNEMADSLLKSDSVIEKMFGVVTKLGVYNFKSQEVIQCVNEAAQNCSRLYDEWKSHC
jgi:uncharacterized protein